MLPQRESLTSLTAVKYCVVLVLYTTVQTDTVKHIGHSMGVSSELVRHIPHMFPPRETVTLTMQELSGNE